MRLDEEMPLFVVAVMKVVWIGDWGLGFGVWGALASRVSR